jgi:hypothetical protein
MRLNLIKRTFIFIVIFVVLLFILKSIDEEHLQSTSFFTLGSLTIYLGFKFNREIDLISTNGVKTKAQVIDFIKDDYVTKNGGTRIYYYPIIKFTDFNQLEITQNLDYSISKKLINKFIKITYLKTDNNYDIILNKKKVLSIYNLFFLIGAVLLFFAFFFFIKNQ